MVFRHENIRVTILAILYFAVAIAEVLCELYTFKPLIYVFKPLMPFLLMCLYFVSSHNRNVLFFVVMSLSLITNVLFIPDSQTCLFYGLIVFLAHRILLLYYIVRLLHLKDYVPAIIGTIPFLLVYFYLFMITDVPEQSFFVLVLQNVLISFICGLSFSHYMMQDSKRNSWLLQSGILFGSLHFIVFVEKFYLTGFSPIIFRPMAMGLNAFAFYTFYEFVMATEKSNGNNARSSA